MLWFGVLHRRPDARWRILRSDVKNLSALQKELLSAALKLVKSGGELIYSVCTVTHAETIDVALELERMHPQLEPIKLQSPKWRAHGNGLQVLPQDAGTDGMTVFKWKV